MYRTILVPLDGSPFGERALAYAAGIADHLGAAIEVVHAYHLPDVAGVTLEPTLEARLKKVASDYLAEQSAQLAGGSGREVTARLLAGDPVPSIADRVEEGGIDLIVMATHGLGGIQRAWLGSVADGLVRRVGCPILLIRPDDARGEGERASIPFRRVLVPLDGSPASEQILPRVVPLAQAGTTRFALVRVVPPALAIGRHVMPLDEQRLAEVSDTARHELERVAAGLRDRGFDAVTHVVGHQTPARAILDMAAKAGAELIAMTTRSEGILARMVLGSTADKVLRGSHLPLLILHPAR